MILTYNSHHPRIHPTAFIAPTAVIIGDVTIAEGASVWFGAVIRGDLASIRIGTRTNIQDNCTVHVDPGTPVDIGAGVTIGHNAVVHGCKIEDDCLIGMGTQILNRAHVCAGAIVAAGAVVRQESHIPPGQLAAGTPAVIKKGLAPTATARIREAAAHYCELATVYRENLSHRSANSS
ncbi:MAG: gamma carbonic anhydrase family protein [Desulfosarcinaceae bacterium]|nr:gamma carbonic anhydrase family protein [Desulfosarcinaceae bacterium]